jgi:putative tricarboxylic transport membrane protein
MDPKKASASSRLSAGIDGMEKTLDRWGEGLEKKKFRLYPGIAASVLFIALPLLILFLMPDQIKIREGQRITAGTFPSMMAFIMLGGALLNLARELWKLVRREKLPVIEIRLHTEIKALILLAFLIIYAALMPLTGFSIASAVYGILMLFYFRIRDWRYYLLITVLALSIGFLFKNLLHVRLP